MTDDDREYEQKRDEAFAKAIGQILGTLRLLHNNMMLGLGMLIVAITFNTCLTAGCTSPMADWRSDALAACHDRESAITTTGCEPQAFPEPSCDRRLDAADAAGCLGPAERYWLCESAITWACAPWGADPGSQCDEEYVEYRDCVREQG